MAIRLRPVVAANLERLESAWSQVPAMAGDIVTTAAEPLSIDVQLARAQARQGVDMLR